MNDIITNCPITLIDSKVLRVWVDNSNSKAYKISNEYHTGVDVVASEVYSICAGVCTYVGRSSEERNVIIIQYDHNISFRYCNLDEVKIRKGQTVEYKEIIGIAHDWVHFELITTEYSNWCVRVGNRDYYKHDPLQYASGEVDFSTSGAVEDFVFYLVDQDLQTEF